ncbi:hypothetical protein G6F43_001003 [Rhizopus delemar]|uniref:Uncharacterized protein n=2 Tax=Rhizopus TaxID=4842 RepID=A0A9P7CUK3_9FUNG|nr:hypothetical protein G6F43_001003 [Rhizopus delemar]KAG1553451.1 hypothetical protein G6F51_000599 [Rhizopus arrhizus]KAG1576136.1 hypothetical protein G6F50_000462 [Rhizopus delemar]
MDEPNHQLQMQSQQIEGLSPFAVGDQKLNRHLGYFSGTMINVSQIIGTGIFSNSSYILANCGSGGMMMILWWVGAIFAITGVWNYLELGTMASIEAFPRSGGEQEYLAYQYRKPRELISFVFVIIVGMFGKGSGLAQGASVFGSNVIYAIGGADYINDWAARGFAAYLAVLSKDVIVNSDATVAANLFNTALGGVFGSRVLPVLIGLSSFGSVGSMFYTGSRIILEAARKGYLPYDRFFAKSHPKLQTPVNSLLLLFTISLIFLLAPPPGAVFEFVLAFAGYGDYFFSVMAVIGLLIMRRTHPDIKRPIKTSIVASIIFIMMCIYNLVFIFVPPTSSSASYPYWLPYLMTIIVALLSVGLWYYKVEYKDALSKSYNAEIREDGKQELFEEINKEIDMSK